MRTELYHHSMYDDREAVPSYWEATGGARIDHPPLAHDESCEVAVIGGGYTGLSVALHLARDHGIDVRVLEAGHIGWGASGRNGGFCCLPATKLSIEQMLGRFGLKETRRFYATQVEGMELVRELAATEEIDIDLAGDGNLTVAHAAARFGGLRREAEQLSTLFGIQTRLYSRNEFRDVGHDSTEQYGAMHMSAGFALHPLKLTLGLARAAARRGAHLHAHSLVREWSKDGGRHRLVTAGGTLRAGQVVVAGNGYTRDGLHRRFNRTMLPTISNIVVTRPLSDSELDAQRYRTLDPICNTRSLLFYYRLLPDHRFLFGARGDTTGKPADGERMRAWMQRRLGEVFPAWSEVPIEYFWRGLVCMTRKLTPSAGRLDDDSKVWYGFGYHANGVNTAPWVGRMLARAIAGQADLSTDLPLALRGMPPRFPAPDLRRWALRAAYLWYRIQDTR